MTPPPINWRPDRKILVEFSEAWLFFLGMIASPLAWYRGRVSLALAFWALAILGRGIGLVRPEWLRPVYLGMTLAAWPIGWLTSQITLAVIFYGVFTPLALIFRVIGRDALNRKIDRTASSYWEPYNPDRGPERYLRQF